MHASQGTVCQYVFMRPQRLHKTCEGTQSVLQLLSYQASKLYPPIWLSSLSVLPLNGPTPTTTTNIYQGKNLPFLIAYDKQVCEIRVIPRYIFIKILYYEFLNSGTHKTFLRNLHIF